MLNSLNTFAVQDQRKHRLFPEIFTSFKYFTISPNATSTSRVAAARAMSPATNQRRNGAAPKRINMRAPSRSSSAVFWW